MRKTVDLPGLTAFAVLPENLLEPRVRGAIGLHQLMEALDGVWALPPEERHGQLLHVVHVAEEGMAVEPDLLHGWKLPPIPTQAQVQTSEGAPSPVRALSIWGSCS